MNLEKILHVYNNPMTQHKEFILFGKKILDIRRKFLIRGKWLNYEIPNHLEGKYVYNTQEGNNLISKIIQEGKPAMLARIGGTEMNIVQYLYNNKDKNLQIHYPEHLIKEGAILPGLFDYSSDSLLRFSSEVLEYLQDVDLLFAWNYVRSPEYYRAKVGMLREYANKNLKITTTGPIVEGMFSENTWTKNLKDKKVLVIHPFADTIKKQYSLRENLFENKDILPEFELHVIKAPQGIGENNLKEEYGNWFNALESMQEQMNNIDYDICLVGAGAYGYHLAHYAKKMGKIGIHVAGALQVLFGIKGTRWIQYYDDIRKIINDYWVFPSKEEQPKNHQEYIKGEGCNAYW